jgi:hypothetical protein
MRNADFGLRIEKKDSGFIKSAFRNQEVSHLSGEKFMRNHLRQISVSRKVRRQITRRASLLFALLVLSVSVFMLLSDSISTASNGPMQLVRLNITTDSGLVRIEIVADGSFDEATIEHFSKGRESVFRVHGARSLLRQSYEINEAVAHDVRTIAGEKDGEPYVDVLIALGDGATVAQKRSFNRLVIGVATDFARLRHHSSPSTEVAQARPVAPTLPRASISAPTAAASNFPAINSSITEPAVEEGNAPPQLVASASQTVFRGRTIWDNLPVSPFQSMRFNPTNYLPLFFLPPQNGVNNSPQQQSQINNINMTIDPPGERIGAWIPGTTTSIKDGVGGKPVGKGFLRPSFDFGVLYGDNFFYRSTVGRNLAIFNVTPRIEYELPGETRAIRLAFEERVRRLSNGNWAIGSVIDFDSRFDATSYFHIALRDHFIRSSLDPREFDPAGEVYIVGDTFNHNDLGLRFTFDLNARNRLAIDGDYNLVRWDNGQIAGAPLFINYDEAASGFTFERDVSEETTVLANFTYANGTSSVPFRPQFNGLSDFRRFDIEGGLRIRVSDTSGASLLIGYEHDGFRHAPGANDFDGLVFNLRFRRDLTSNTSFEMASLRKTQVSAFNLEGGNARLVSTGGSARIEYRPTEHVKLALGLNYQQLSFPLPLVPTSTASGGVFVGQFAGEHRRDNLYGFSLEAAYRWSDLVRTRFVYSFQRRDTTIPVLTFNRNRLALIFELGRRNDVRGRPF